MRRLEIELTAVACHNASADFDAEIVYNTGTKRGQKVIQKGLPTREEAMKVAEKFVDVHAKLFHEHIMESLKFFKDAQE